MKKIIQNNVLYFEIYIKIKLTRIISFNNA